MRLCVCCAGASELDLRPRHPRKMRCGSGCAVGMDLPVGLTARVLAASTRAKRPKCARRKSVCSLKHTSVRNAVPPRCQSMRSYVNGTRRPGLRSTGGRSRRSCGSKDDPRGIRTRTGIRHQDATIMRESAAPCERCTASYRRLPCLRTFSKCMG